MKKFLAFTLAFILAALSIFIYYPSFSYADDDKTVLPCNLKDTMSFSSSDAQSYVSAYKDIYSQDGILLFAYTPSGSYNWTLCKDGKLTNVHMSDKQVTNYIMTDKSFTLMQTVFLSFISNSRVSRGLLSVLGAIVTEDSDTYLNALDTITGNYNYLNAISYDETTQTITMDSSSVDALREEIRSYYYDLIGMIQKKPSGTVKNVIDSSKFRNIFEYEEDYINAYGYGDYKYCIASEQNIYFFLNELTDYYYLGSSTDTDRRIPTYDGLTYTAWKIYSYDCTASSPFTMSDTSTLYSYSFTDVRIPSELTFFYCISQNDFLTDNHINKNWGETKRYTLFSSDMSPFCIFKSYSALYNYINGDQTAYLSSEINKTGQDITFSINDMNENIGSKMDELIDSINSGKASMSQDELQKAIDNGLEELNKNTEEIKDNTNDILDVLKEQNQILMQILGVTEYIAYQTTKDDGTSYTKTDLTNTINKIYNGLGNAILYGKNTLTDSGSSEAASQSSIVTRHDFKLSNSSSFSGVSPGNSPIVVYSSSDTVTTQDINNMDIHDGLFGKFPFSVPYQLYEWLQVLQAEPVAPTFNYNYGFLIGKKDDAKCNVKIDLSIYEPWANVCKSFLRLSFTLLMAVFIFRHFSNNKSGGGMS